MPPTEQKIDKWLGLLLDVTCTVLICFWTFDMVDKHGAVQYVGGLVITYRIWNKNVYR